LSENEQIKVDIGRYVKMKKISPNAPCPCGSKNKYKGAG